MSDELLRWKWRNWGCWCCYIWVYVWEIVLEVEDKCNMQSNYVCAEKGRKVPP